ncbi:MAG: hypothetical protein AB7H88_05390 [Vicinamibacterales bacterium]
MATLANQALIDRLRTVAESAGLEPVASPAHALAAEREIPLGKWFLGGRKVVYRLSCDLDEGAHDVRFRESTTESSWGVPPPAFTVETTSQSGTAARQQTTVTSPGGGGRFELGQIRDRFEGAAREAGWDFHIEVGKKP